MDLFSAKHHGAQLFFADMRHSLTRTTITSAPPGSAPRWPDRPVAHRQQVLFSHPWDFTRGRTIFPSPRDQVLAAALDRHVTVCAETADWSRVYTSDVRSGIRLLLGTQDTPGAPIAASAVAELTAFRLPVRTITELLDEVGMLDDDRIPAIERWFAGQLIDLPEPMSSELRTWFDIMHTGSTAPPRTKPRRPNTIKLYLTAALPALRTFAAGGHTSLREISRDDVLAVLPQGDTERAMMGRGLRSIFGILKARKLIFANPTTGLHTWFDASKPPETIDLDAVREAFMSPNPARALICALVAYHGLRTSDLLTLRLTDISDQRLHLDQRCIPLADPVLDRLASWLDHRSQRWPHTTNPHLFVHFRTAKRDDPVGRRWIKLTLDIDGGVQAIRQDRILHEAIATDGDTRRLCDLFGLSIQQASRYTHAIHEPTAPTTR